MKVLYVASEAVPFAKTGGLADVAGSLPKALKAEGVDVRVIMPKFGKIPEKFRDAMEHVYDGEIPVAWRSKFVGLDKLEHDGVTYYFVDNEEYFKREGFYGYDDDAERFSFFCRAVLNVDGHIAGLDKEVADARCRVLHHQLSGGVIVLCAAVADAGQQVIVHAKLTIERAF